VIPEIVHRVQRKMVYGVKKNVGVYRKSGCEAPKKIAFRRKKSRIYQY